MFPKIFCEDDSDIEVFDTSNSLISFYSLFDHAAKLQVISRLHIDRLHKI